MSHWATVLSRLYVYLDICFFSSALHSSPGTLTECYDELGNRYQLPVYCLAPPVNLISERSDEDPSDSPEPPVAPKKEFQLKVP